MYRIDPTSPDHPAAAGLLERLGATLSAITGASGGASFDPRDVTVDGSLFVIARDPAGKAVGCGAYRPLGPGIAELKRMYAAPGTRGLGAEILAFLERRAAADGYAEMRLETRAVNLRAVRFYERNGYRRVPNFGRYVDRPEAVCFGRRLDRPA
jgi:ribosomal protein S18 acetylase RimI-like enzyme